MWQDYILKDISIVDAMRFADALVKVDRMGSSFIPAKTEEGDIQVDFIKASEFAATPEDKLAALEAKLKEVDAKYTNYLNLYCKEAEETKRLKAIISHEDSK